MSSCRATNAKQRRKSKRARTMVVVKVDYEKGFVTMRRLSTLTPQEKEATKHLKPGEALDYLVDT